MPQTLGYLIAFVIVLALIGATAWLVRRFAGSSIGGSATRGRMPRLAVIDAAAVDGRRRLVLVRRDNVEHLLIIGGPTDVVVETNIVRSVPQRDQTPARSPAGTELPARVSPLPDANSWADNDGGRSETFESPETAVPERAARAQHLDEARRPSPSIAERRTGGEFSSFVPEPMIRPEPALRPDSRPGRSEPRAEPAIPRMSRPPEPPSRGPAAPARPGPRPPEPAMSAADQNLAEMAQRLEAALRRPGSTDLRLDGGEPRAPVVSQMDRVGAPSVAPESPASRPAPRAPDLVESVHVASQPAPPSPDIIPSAPAGKPSFDNLEDEMASLLGRPKNST